MITRLLGTLSRLLLLLLLAILFSLSIEAQTKIRSNQINLGDTFVFTGANTHNGVETFKNFDNVLYVDGVNFTTISSALAALPSTGGTVIVPCAASIAPYTETLAANIVIPFSNVTIQFLCPATITMGSFQVTSAAGINGVTIQGPFRGNANSIHPAPVRFIYTGTGAAFQFGASSASSFDYHFERFGIDISGAGNAAQALQVNRAQDVTLDEMTLVGKQASGTTQICYKSDGTGGFSAYHIITAPHFLGCHITVDFAGPADGNNQNQIIGGYITPNNTTDGIAVFIETGDTNNFLWPDLFSANIGIRLGGNSFSNSIMTRIETNTTDVQFDSGAGVGGGDGNTVWTRTTPVVVDNSANNNNIASQFPSGYLSLFKNIRTVETSAPTLGATGFDDCFGSSSAHALQCSYNGGTYFNVAQVITATSAAFATATTAGTCVQNTTAVTGATTSMVATASPVSTPGVGAQWSAFVSSSGNVTINECAVAASAGGTIAFNIRVTP